MGLFPSKDGTRNAAIWLIGEHFFTNDKLYRVSSLNNQQFDIDNPLGGILGLTRNVFYPLLNVLQNDLILCE
jgi:hypothetical protein